MYGYSRARLVTLLNRCINWAKYDLTHDNEGITENTLVISDKQAIRRLQGYVDGRLREVQELSNFLNGIGD